MVSEVLNEAERDPSHYIACLSCGVNCSMFRSTFLKVGGFDAALRYVNEDMELGVRIDIAGIRMVFEPRAMVYHHSTKTLSDEFSHSYLRTGAADVYRVTQKRQRNLQTEALAALHSGRVAQRLKQYVAWGFPRTLRSSADICRWATDVTGCEFFFRRWETLIASTAYWEGVRSTGTTLELLRRLVGSCFPVFMFHSISATTDRRQRQHFLSPHQFSRFMRWLENAGYQCLSSLDYESASIPPRSVFLTFDDGYEDFYSTAFPVLNDLGMKATVFIVAGRIGQTNVWDEQKGFPSRQLLSVSQIRELHREGVTFGSHSLSHRWLPELSDADLQREIVDSKSILEDLLGSEVAYFAYPSGGVDARVRKAVARAGYKVAMGTFEGLTFWEDQFCLNRIGICEMDRLHDFRRKVVTGRSLRQEISAEFLERLHAGLDKAPSAITRQIKVIAGKVRTNFLSS
jgi:peptidoglycan/xylan/chitin deacetylase (PgdA/CDA1 family)